MGFNSILFIPNDQLSSVDNHPEQFAKEVSRACGSMGQGRLPGRFNNFRIPYIGHADDMGVVTVGGNHAETVLQFHQGRHGHHSAECKEFLLRRLADSMGFEIRSKTE